MHRPHNGDDDHGGNDGFDGDTDDSEGEMVMVVDGMGEFLRVLYRDKNAERNGHMNQI